jgi:hypothetical protein
MPLNKIHDIVDDAEDQVGVDVEHSTRIGLARNTVEQAIPVILHPNDIPRLIQGVPKMKAIKSFDNTVLHVRINGVHVAVLLVYTEEGIRCIPYSERDGKWCVYDLYILLRGEDLILRGIHPLMDEVDEISGITMEHVEALTSLCWAYLYKMDVGEISVVEDSEDFTKINSKRYKNNKTKLINDWEISWSDSDSPSTYSSESSDVIV